MRSGALINPIIANTGAGLGIGLLLVSNTGTVVIVTKIFDFNLFAGNINLSTNERSKLYLKVIEALSLNQRVNIIIKTSHKVRNILENNYSTFAWGKLIAKVPNTAENKRYIIKNYKCISL